MRQSQITNLTPFHSKQDNEYMKNENLLLKKYTYFRVDFTYFLCLTYNTFCFVVVGGGGGGLGGGALVKLKKIYI